MRYKRSRWLPLVASCLIAVSLFFFLRRMSWEAMGRALSHAKLRWIACAIALSWVNVLMRSCVLRILIRPVSQFSQLRALRYTVASITGSILGPLRAGEALRAWLLVHRERATLPACGAVYLYEKVGDLLALLTVALPLAWTLKAKPVWVSGVLASALALLVASTVIVPLVRRTSFGARLLSLAYPIGTGNTLPLAGMAVLAAWTADMCSVMAVLHAVGAPDSPTAASLVLLAINIAISVPMPANGGTLEFGAMIALQTFGVPKEQAFAFALLYHATQVLPVLAVGIWDGLYLLSGTRAVPTPPPLHVPSKT